MAFEQIPLIQNLRQKKNPSQSWGSFFTFVLVVVLFRSLLISPFRIPSGSMIPTLKVGDFIVASKISYGWSRYSLLFGGYINYFSGKVLEFSFPKRGDVIVFTPKNNTTMDYIKRVVGVPGDEVQMRDGYLHLNGKKIPLKEIQKNYKDFDGYYDESHGGKISGTVYEARLPRDGGEISYHVLKQEAFGKGYLDNTPLCKVPADSVFCMGDNWDGSSDSREVDKLGCVSKEYFIGPALFVFFSLDYEHLSWFKPWTWLLVPFKIRYNRCVYYKI